MRIKKFNTVGSVKRRASSNAEFVYRPFIAHLNIKKQTGLVIN